MPHTNESWRSSYARCPYCGFEAGRGVNGRLAAHGTDCPPIQFAYAMNIQNGMVLGPVTLELHRYAFCTLHQLYAWDPLRHRYGCLSEPARRCLRDATKSITGMEVSANEYWLPQIMSEAIEAAEALGL